MKLSDESLSGISANSATFFSPREGKSISSWLTTPAICGRLNFSSRTPRLINIDFAVLPETNCQGLFHQKSPATVKHFVTELNILIFPFGETKFIDRNSARCYRIIEISEVLPPPIYAARFFFNIRYVDSPATPTPPMPISIHISTGQTPPPVLPVSGVATT